MKYIKHIKRPVFLKADDPEDEISTRRIHFYETREKSCKLWFMGNQPVE